MKAASFIIFDFNYTLACTAMQLTYMIKKKLWWVLSTIKSIEWQYSQHLCLVYSVNHLIFWRTLISVQLPPLLLLCFRFLGPGQWEKWITIKRQKNDSRWADHKQNNGVINRRSDWMTQTLLTTSDGDIDFERDEKGSTTYTVIFHDSIDRNNCC